MANNLAATRVRDAVAELKSSVRELIEDAPPAGVEGIFEGLYPGRAALSVRGARMNLFNAVVTMLATDLRGARKRAKGKT